jgi:hypothetical protein
MTDKEQADVARSRFMILTLVRVSGVALMLFGMGVTLKGWAGLPESVGTLIFLVGFIDSLIVPRLLARKWRTPSGK